MFSTVRRLQEEAEERLLKLSFPASPDTLYEPVRYMLSLGGKRMRPVLLMMAYDLFGDEPEKAWPSALGIEVFHNFTLLHDDIMDKAPLRRGKSTVHAKWNSNIAILSGDAMFVKSCQLVMQSPGRGVMDMFLKTALEVCEGQQLDMDFESRITVSIAEYLEMIRLKTAVLLGGGLAMGARIAGAGDEAAGHLYTFGTDLGVAFQLQDDILDVYGDAGKFGKQVGGDILSNKKTFLLLTAMERARDKDAEELRFWLSKSDDPASKVEAVTALFNRFEVREAAIARMDELYRDALLHLDALPLPSDRTVPLRELAAMLMDRDH
jgi:geranylgeranyl diphosphate synthase type II